MVHYTYDGVLYQKRNSGSEQIYIVTGVAFNKVGETKTVKYLSAGIR